MGRYLDGRVTAVVGTHTHIPTADERLLPKGTAYITDLGMTGPRDSVLGREVDAVLQKFVTGMPTRFKIASEDVALEGVLLQINDQTGRALSIQRVRIK
jgi:calcineurin-like phosphoesterase